MTINDANRKFLESEREIKGYIGSIHKETARNEHKKCKKIDEEARHIEVKLKKKEQFYLYSLI